MEKLATSEEWYKELNPPYTIIDPDGWDRSNYQFSYFEELITEKEFNRRLMYSTICWK